MSFLLASFILALEQLERNVNMEAETLSVNLPFYIKHFQCFN